MKFFKVVLIFFGNHSINKLFTHTNYLRKLKDTLSHHHNQLLFIDRNIRGKKKNHVISAKTKPLFLDIPKI